MTKDASFKRRVRDRMAKTGESYATARGQLAGKRERVEAARTRLASVDDRPADDKVEGPTGRTWDEWFTLLDAWGAQQRKHRDIAAYLVEEHGVPGWWAQSITMWFERDRGLRLKHQQAHGFTINASRTMAVPAGVAFAAFVDPGTREAWLTDGTLTLRVSQPDRSARFDWDGGPTRVNVSFDQKGPAKTSVAVAHERLPDPDEAEMAKALWRKRLAELKSFLEG